jgi:hypothetical protein
MVMRVVILQPIHLWADGANAPPDAAPDDAAGHPGRMESAAEASKGSRFGYGHDEVVGTLSHSVCQNQNFFQFRHGC